MGHSFRDSETAKGFSSSRTKTTALITHDLGVHARAKVVASMKSSRVFSILMDETTDIGCRKQCAMLVRYTDAHGVLQTRFYDMKVVNSATGENLFRALNKCLEDDGLSFDQLVGFGSDNASNMVGRHNSVWSRILQKQPAAYLSGCVCHIAATVCSDACAKLPNRVEDLVVKLFTYFYQSSVRQERLDQFVTLCDIQPARLLRPCQTRWLSLQAVVNRVLLLLTPLKEFFNSEPESDRVNKIRQELGDPTTELYLLFLMETLPFFTQFNLLFQERKPNLHRLADNSRQLLRTLLLKLIEVEEMPDDVRSADSQLYDPKLLDEDKQRRKPKLGVRTPDRLREMVESGEVLRPETKSFYKDIKSFYVTAIQSLTKKMPKCTDETQMALSILAPKASAIQSKAMQLARRFPQIIDEDSLPTLHEELERYEANPSALPTVTDMETYWNEVRATGQYPTLIKLIYGLYVIPHGNADTERLFSSLNNIKTDLRNRLGDDTLNHILHTKHNLTTMKCYEWEPQQTIVSQVKKATKGKLEEKAAEKAAAAQPTDEQAPSTSAVMTAALKRPANQRSIVDMLAPKRARKPKMDENFITADILVVESADNDSD